MGAALARTRKFSSVVQIQLLDELGSRDNIVAALNRLATGSAPPLSSPPALRTLQQVQPEDAVIIYFAGHGFTRNGRYYVLPRDVGSAKSAATSVGQWRDSLAVRGISDQALRSHIAGMDSPRILLIIDACQSGQVLETEEHRFGPLNSDGISQLAYDKGMYVLAATQPDQSAVELPALRHGLMTHVLVEKALQAMGADIAPQDGRITVRELLDYTVRQTRTDVQAIFGRGLQDMSVERLPVQEARAFYPRTLEQDPWLIDVR